MAGTVQLVARIELPYVSRALVPRYMYDYYSNCAGMRAQDGLTAEGFLWELDRHGHWPFEELFYLVRVGDLNGDGVYEYLSVRGAMSQVAFDHQGRVLWQYQDDDATMADIRTDSEFPIYDVDGDGRAEVVCARRVEGQLSLCLVDGLSGAIKTHVPYPRPDLIACDFRGAIQVADLRGSGDARDIVVSWDYNYAGAFNERLEMLWEIELSTPRQGGDSRMGHGHGVRCGDVDGDGHDEVLCGATLADHDGTVLWSRADLPKVKGDHVDGAVIADVNGDGEKEIFFATGGYLLDASGKVLWGLGDKVIHGQCAQAGKLREDVDGLQIVLNDENWSRNLADGRTPLVYVLDKDGRELLKVPCGAGQQGPMLGDWDGDGLSELLVPLDDRIDILDGCGRTLGTIPKSMPGARIGGPTELPFVGDVTGDSRAEVLVVGQQDRQAWLEVFANGDGNRDEGTSQVPAVRRNTKALANWCLY